jgi:hypothetical protein
MVAPTSFADYFAGKSLLLSPNAIWNNASGPQAKLTLYRRWLSDCDVEANSFTAMNSHWVVFEVNETKITGTQIF